MKDFAVRVYDPTAHQMIVLTDFSLNTFYKLHDGMKTGEPMLASPYYDVNGERLFENDVVIGLAIPRSLENVYWGNIERFPTDYKEYIYEGYELEFYVVCFGDEWHLRGEVGVYFSGYETMHKTRLRYDNWRGIKYANENSIRYVKIGDIYSCSKIITEAKRLHAEKEEAEKREKELQCFMKLKEKYETNEMCVSK